jgi:hypothetical protein
MCATPLNPPEYNYLVPNWDDPNAICINKDRPIIPLPKTRSPNQPQKRDRPITHSKTRSLNKFDNSYCYLLLLEREY